MPMRIPEILLWYKYVVKDFTKGVYNPYLTEGQEWAKKNGYYDYVHDDLKKYLDTEPITKQAKIALYICLVIAIISLWMMIKTCFCFLRCCGFNCPCCFFCCGCCSKSLAYPNKVKEDKAKKE
jgi:hypothetical protein